MKHSHFNMDEYKYENRQLPSGNRAAREELWVQPGIFPMRISLLSGIAGSDRRCNGLHPRRGSGAEVAQVRG